MKKVLLSIVLFLSLGLTAWAQVPNLLNYQGIARTATGSPIASTVISLRLTIHEGTSTGAVDYCETQSTTTNQYGLYTLAIGSGTPISTSPLFNTVAWGSGAKYLQVEIDPMGAADYSPAGTAQLLAVPYALYAANAPATGVTSVTAGTGLNGGTITSTGTISLPNEGVAGTYGSATTVPMITTDAQGRVTAVTNTLITAGAGTVTSVSAGPGLAGGPITSSGSLSLGTAGTPGIYGSGTMVPVFTTDVYGRVTAVTNTPITVAGSGTVTSVTAGAGLSGGTITTTGTVSMPTVGTAGVYGSPTGIPEITTDAYGRVTHVTVNPVSSITSTGNINYIAKFTNIPGTAIGNSGMYNTPGGQVGLGTIAPIATFDAESATDTMAGNFVISSGTPPANGVLSGSYTGTGTSASAIAIIGTAEPSLFTSSGLGVGGIGGSLGISGVAQSEDPAGGPTGVQGQSFSDGAASIGVLGFANGIVVGVGANDNYGVYGSTDGSGVINDFAGEFQGDLDVTGTITAGTKSFKIDHPLDPENKYLYHSCVESNEMMDIYTGNVTTDASGVAVVSFPGYMEALNKDFRYQLTVIGTFAQAIISKELTGNKFEIKTSEPNVKVSWQVTGVRHDAFAVAHPLVVEKDKVGSDKGKYFNAAAYGKPSSMQIGRITPKALKGVKSVPGVPKRQTTSQDTNNK